MYEGEFYTHNHENKHGDPIFGAFFLILSVNYGKFEKKCDSITISRELPQGIISGAIS